VVKLIPTIEIVGGPEHLTAAYKRALPATLREAGGRWHSTTLPRHFQPEAVGRYGYEPRSRRHMIRKAQQFHHQRPLVFTGELERAVTGQAEIRASQAGRLSVKLRGPRHLHAYRKDYGQPDKAAEITAVHHQEEAEIGELVGTRQTAALVNCPTRTRRRL